MSIPKIQSAGVSLISNKVLEALKPDVGAKAAMAELAKNNPGNKTISGEEMAAAITKGTIDPDNQAAGKEYAVIKQFVDKNGAKLSPEAKKVFEVYKKQVELAKANGQTGIEPRAYAKMTRDMAAAGKPQYADKSAAESLKELAKGNKEAGSISGKEMTDAILKGTKDLDGQAAGAEYRDISKFVRENQQLLSPEAKAAFAVYDKAAKAAQAKGQTGIDDASFQRMARDMAKAGAPKNLDASMGSALGELAAKNTTPGSISAKELADAVSKGARDLDGQSAGAEYKDLAKFVKENKQLLSPDALKAFGMYEKAAVAAQQKGSTSVGTLEQFDKLIKDMGNVGAKPPTPPAPPTNPTTPTTPTTPAQPGVDAGAAKSLDELGRANPGPGSISGNEMAAAIKAATEDLDNQAAGTEYRQIAKFVKENEGKLSPEAKKAFEVYQKAAKAAQGRGETGIPTPVYNAMVKEMEAAGKPKYQDAGMGDELNKLAAANTTPGSVTAKQLSEAISKGARDLDGSSAGKEFEDLAKFVAENQQLLTPDAKAAFAMYEKAAMAAREKGSTSVGTLEQFDKLIKDMASVGTSSPTTTTATPPSGQASPLQEPIHPGPNATDADLAKFEKELKAYLASLPLTAAQQSGIVPPVLPGPNATPAEKMKYQADTLAYVAALKAKGLEGPPQLVLPVFPGPNASAFEMAQYANNIQKYVSMLQPKAGSSSNATASPTPSTGSTSPTPQTSAPAQVAAAGGIEDRALAGLSALKEPTDPGPNASEADLAKYQRDLGKYNRMFEMYSKIMANAHEMKKSLIANFPR